MPSEIGRDGFLHPTAGQNLPRCGTTHQASGQIDVIAQDAISTAHRAAISARTHGAKTDANLWRLNERGRGGRHLHVHADAHAPTQLQSSGNCPAGIILMRHRGTKGGKQVAAFVPNR